MSKAHLFCIFLLLAAMHCASAQSYVFNYQVPVLQDGVTLRNPFAGGLNNPQFSSIDINQDGHQDVYIFDRAGNISMVLLNTGDIGSTERNYWYQYSAQFPPMRDWTVLIDYNCDGLEDIITGSESGIKTYLAGWDGFSVTFTEDVSKMQYTEAGFFFDLPVGYIDIPGFSDIDFDGDIDVLTFNMTGGIVDHYINTAVEDGMPCGTFALEHINSCWGNFYESGITYSVELDYECKGVTRTTDGVHAGSTFMIFDEDGDNDMDIVLGDLAFNVLNRLENGGDNTFAHITAQDTTFPSYDKPYDNPIYPAAFLIDVDNDGAKDMLVAPNNLNQSETRKNIWYYRNTKTDGTYTFDYQHDSLFVSDMIDLGDGAYPVFYDHNYDGLMDMVIGNYGYYADGDQIGKLALFENTGTSSEPAYTLITRNYAGLADFGFNAIAPTFGDLDGDGDEDMLIGEEDGFVHFFKNIAPAGGPASFVLFGANYQGIDPGQNSVPQLIDVSGDGLDDLIIGERNGNLNYYLNTGTAALPAFTLQSEFWGNVDVRTLGSLTGHSAPFLFMHASGDYTLFVGCEDGTIYQYDPTADFTGSFAEITSAFNDIDAGAFSSVAMADINNDALPELIIGNKRGGVMLFRDALSTNIQQINNIRLQVYPNPATNTLYVTLPGPSAGAADIALYDLQGRKLFVPVSELNDQVISLNIADLPGGMYVIRLISNAPSVQYTTSFIKQ